MDLSYRLDETSVALSYFVTNATLNTIGAGEEGEGEPAALVALEATRRLIELEIPFLRRAVRRWQRSAADADDLVQATLLRALSSVHLWQPGSNLRAWLVTIMRNEFYTELARETHASAAVGVGEAAVSHRSADAETRLVLRDVERVLLRLPAVQRLTVLLAGIEGKSYDETARIMGLSVDAVRCHLARARARLRQSVYSGEDASPLKQRASECRFGVANGSAGRVAGGRTAASLRVAANRIAELSL